MIINGINAQVVHALNCFDVIATGFSSFLALTISFSILSPNPFLPSRLAQTSCIEPSKDFLASTLSSCCSCFHSPHSLFRAQKYKK